MKRQLTFIIPILLCSVTLAHAQNWTPSGSNITTTTTDYNTSIQLTHIGFGSHHGILFNAYRSPSLVNGFLNATGNTKNSFAGPPYSSGAGAIMYIGNGGRMDFLIAGESPGAGTDVVWGHPKMTINRSGVGVGSDDPQATLEVRKNEVATGQTATVAAFTIKGENHFDQPGVYSEGRISLGTKAYGNGILKRAEIGYSTAGLWRGGMLKFYTTPDDDTWVPIQRMVINHQGNVGIGTTNPDAKLAVNGTIHTKEVKVDMNNWSDYVFNKDYKLRSLSDVQQYIEENHHLPDVPSEKEVLASGQNLGEMNAILLKKIEELTLYMIDATKRIETLEALLKQAESKR